MFLSNYVFFFNQLLNLSFVFGSLPPLPLIPFDGLLVPAVVASPCSIVFVVAPLHFVGTSLKPCLSPLGPLVALPAIGYDFAFFQKSEGLVFGNEQVSLGILILYLVHRRVVLVIF